MKKLYEIEYEYQSAREDALYRAEDGCSLEELVEDIGFNVITILNPNEEDTDKEDVCVYYGSDNYERLSEDAKNCNCFLSSEYEDYDGYICVNVVLENKEDWKYFKESESE